MRNVKPSRSNEICSKSDEKILISSQTLLVAVTTLRELGFEVTDLMKRHAITGNDLDTPGHQVTRRRLVNFVVDALSSRHCQDFGIKVARKVRPSNWGMLGYAVASSQTVGEAFELGQRYQMLASNVHRLNLSNEANQTSWIAQPYFDYGIANRFFIEEEFITLIELATVLTGKPFNLIAAEFRYAEPDYVEQYQQKFRCTLRFNAPQNRLVFDTGMLAIRMLQSNPVTCSVARTFCESYLKQHPDAHPLVMKIRCLILERPADPPDLESLAQHFGYTGRTLRNRLAELNTGYRDILESIQIELTKRYLDETHFSLEQIAGRIGYSDARALRRAFSRSTGLPPSSYRAQSIQGQ